MQSSKFTQGLATFSPPCYFRRVKSRLAIALVLCCCGALPAPPPPSVLDDLLPEVQNWLRENLDESVLQALAEVDRDRVRAFFDELQKRSQGDDIYDLGALRETAATLLPLLERFEETRPYAGWLATRLDYLQSAEELRRQARPAPPRRGLPPPLPPPTLQLQRTVWTRQLEKRPLPPRASALVPKLQPIFAAEKVPAQLVWLAEVESSFNPDAKSPAGAAGLFQLMKPTAKSLGLSTWLPDERLHPEKSARAAARYLRHLHARFGDWRLALAAYNAGENRVAGLLKKSHTRTYDAIARRLPAETQLFVPKCEATIKQRTGVALAELKMPKG